MKNGRDILGLSFENDQLSAARHDSNGVVTRLVTPFAVDPLGDDPQLVAQELRERLQPLGRLPRCTVVCLPLNRVMLASVAVPDLAAEAVPGFLRLQAEREFLLDPDDFAFGVSQYDAGAGRRGALLAALPDSLYTNLQRALRLTGTRQLQVTLTAVMPFTDMTTPEVRAFLVAGPATVDLGVTGGGGIILLRRLLRNPPEAVSGTFDSQALLGELRITLGQLPPDIRRRFDSVCVHGPRPLAERLAQQLTEAAPPPAAGGWLFTSPAAAVGTPEAAGDGAVTPGELAARRLAAGQGLPLVLAPVQVQARYRFLQNWTRRQRLAAAAGSALVLISLLALLLYQRHQYVSLQAQWQEMSPRVDNIRALIAEARAQRPWVTDEPESLVLLRAVTEAFPKRGTVWATRLEVRDRQQVSLSGKAASREAWLQMLEALRCTAGVCDLRVAEVHDMGDNRAALAFTLGFNWQPGATGQPKQGASQP